MYFKVNLGSKVKRSIDESSYIWIASAGLTITFSSCTVGVSAHAYIYPTIVKFCPDIGLESHYSECRSIITNAFQTLPNNLQQCTPSLPVVK